MSATWSSIAEQAFDFRRAWRKSNRPGDLRERDGSLSDVDATVLSLLVQIGEIDHVVCADDEIRTALATAFDAVPAHAPVVCSAVPGSDPLILLTPLAGLGEVAGVRQPSVVLVYGLRGFLQGPIVPATTASGLRLLGPASPALWQCGLAIAAAPDEQDAASALVDKLAQTLKGEWIDPLALLEKVQLLSARLRRLGQSDVDGQDMREDRIAQLEDEIEVLRRSALVRQRSLVAAVTDPARAVP